MWICRQEHRPCLGKDGDPCLPAGPGPVQPSGIAIGVETELSVDQRVFVKWSEIWWSGEVLQVMSGGEVKVHYTGWGAEWDEVVTRTRLHLPRSRD